MGIGLLGAGILSFFGATGAWAAAGGIVAGIVGGAVVGAAIGGLSAAIMGGNVLEGMLFGAIGGAVTGGVSAWAAGGTFSGISGAGMAAEGVEAAGYATQHIGEAAGAVQQSTSSLMSGVGSKTLEMATNQGGSIVSDFIKEGIGGWMDAEAGQDTSDAALMLAREKMQHEKDITAMNIAGQRGFDPAGMANVAARREELELERTKYKEGREDIQQAKEQRGAALSGSLGGGEVYDPLANIRAEGVSEVGPTGAAPIDKIEGVN